MNLFITNAVYYSRSFRHHTAIITLAVQRLGEISNNSNNNNIITKFKVINRNEHPLN